MIAEDLDAARVIVGYRRPLSRRFEIIEVQRLETDEYTGTACQCHFAHERRIIGHIDRERPTPNDLKGLERLTQRTQIVRSGAEIVVDEDRIRLSVACDLGGDLLDIARPIRHLE